MMLSFDEALKIVNQNNIEQNCDMVSCSYCHKDFSGFFITDKKHIICLECKNRIENANDKNFSTKLSDLIKLQPNDFNVILERMRESHPLQQAIHFKNGYQIVAKNITTGSTYIIDQSTENNIDKIKKLFEEYTKTKNLNVFDGFETAKKVVPIMDNGDYNIYSDVFIIVGETEDYTIKNLDGFKI